MARFFRLIALLLLGLLLPRLAEAQCVGAGGVPFNCVPGGAIGSSDLLLGGQSSNTVKFTAAQISSFVLGGTQPGVFSSITVPSGGGGELDGVFTGNPTWSGTSTFNGPLDLTPTGGNTLRSQQDIDADVTNVLSFTGVDPTGSTDSCAGINAALAVGKATYLPHGTYYVKCALNAGPGTTLYGDGRGVTTITVDQSFDPSALGVIVLTGAEQASPIIRDMSLSFAQPSTQSSRAAFQNLGTCTSGSGGTGCKYPPGIYSATSNRFKVLGVQFDAAWDGIWAVNNVGFIQDIEMGALDVGLHIGEARDFMHISHFHFWNFGINASSALWSVFTDGNTFAARIGETGGAGGDYTDFDTLVGRVYITGGSVAYFDYLSLDSGPSLEVVSNAGGFVQVLGGYSSGGGSLPTHVAPITLSGTALLQISNFYGGANGSPIVSLSSGVLHISGSSLGSNVAAANLPVIDQTGGQLFVDSTLLSVADQVTPWTVPIVRTTGGTVRLTGNMFKATNSGGQAGVSISTDFSDNVVSGNNFNGWPFTAPGTLGFYSYNSDGNIQGPVAMTGPVHVTGGNMFVEANINGAGVAVSGLAGTDRNLEWQTSTTVGLLGLTRWNLFALNNAESGANAGSDLLLQNYADDGTTVIGTPLQVKRSSGLVTLQVASVTNNATVGGILGVNNAAGTQRSLIYETAGLNRWVAATSNGAESGGNAGSDYALLAYADDGTTLLSVPLQIKRSTGAITLTGAVTLSGITVAANCTGQPSKSIIATTGTGVLVQCP